MRYANILYDAVLESGWSYTQIVERCKKKGLKISRSYISKLCTGHMPPASDEVNKALAEVLSQASSITYTKLAIAKYKEIIPKEIYEAIASGQ